MKRTRLLYVGNRLADRGGNPTTIDILGPKLADDFEVIRVSNKENVILRIVDIWITIVRNYKQVDVMIIDTYSTWAFHFAWTSAYLASFFKIPYLPLIHGGDFPKRIESSPKLVKKFLDCADIIITPSGFLEERIKARGFNHILIIPNFINLTQYPYVEKRAFDGFKLLWVRALADIYNPKMAIDVLHHLHSKGNKIATLTMVGPDKDNIKESLQKYADSKGLSNSISFTGQVAKKEWLSMAADFDCFLNTTTVDNTPISVMEAMALGMVVISTEVGGIPYIIEDGIDGLLVADGDVVSMADAIVLLKNTPSLYQGISKAARKKTLAWDWKVVHEKWIGLLSNYSPRKG